MKKKEPARLLEAIVRIAHFSYEPSISKYPFLKEYLTKEKNPKTEWVLLMTVAGTGYALLTKEGYHGEHDELMKSIIEVKGLGVDIGKILTSTIHDYEKDKAKSL